MPAPPALRRFLGFAKLPGTALAVVRRVVDEEDAFRARVRDATSEAEVGRAGWLYLARPAGWEDELQRLLAVAESEATRAAGARADKDARRRAARAEESARRAMAAADAARHEADAARSDLAAERQARRALESEAGRVRQRLERLGRESEAARTEAAEAAAARDAALASRDAAIREVAALRARVDELQAALAAAGPAPTAAPAAMPPVREPAAPLDTEGLAEALAQAAAALAAAARSLGGAAPRGHGTSDPMSTAPPAGAPPRRRRERVRLPPGVRDDTAEAAAVLVRSAGVVALVDGYNVSLRGWADRPLAEQRQRLVDGLSALAARTGMEAHVVFDGTDEAARTVTADARSRVRLVFTADGVEADDVLVEVLDALPVTRPVIVVSNDRRVRDEAGSRGANLLTSEQLLGLLRG